LDVCGDLQDTSVRRPANQDSIRVTAEQSIRGGELKLFRQRKLEAGSNQTRTGIILEVVPACEDGVGTCRELRIA